MQPGIAARARRVYRTGTLNASPPLSWLQRAPDLAWMAFLVWTGVGFVVMPLGVGEGQLRPWLGPGAAGDLAGALLHRADAVWMLLAAINVYLQVVLAEGLPTARVWAGLILVASTVFEWVGTRTGFPFGPYVYTDNFGWRIGGVVPLAIPLAWLVVVLCGRSLVGWLHPAATRLELALGVAVVAVLTDLNLEYVAWKVRAYWIWYPQARGMPPSWPPWQNYLSWFALSFALAFLLPPNHELRARPPHPRRPVLVLALMNALLALVHLLR